MRGNQAQRGEAANSVQLQDVQFDECPFRSSRLCGFLNCGHYVLRSASAPSLISYSWLFEWKRQARLLTVGFGAPLGCVRMVDGNVPLS
jgi:hypothetical protein